MECSILKAQEEVMQAISETLFPKFLESDLFYRLVADKDFQQAMQQEASKMEENLKENLQVSWSYFLIMFSSCGEDVNSQCLSRTD